MVKKILLAVFAFSVIGAAALLAVKLGLPGLKTLAVRQHASSADTTKLPAGLEPGSIESNILALCRELEADSSAIKVSAMSSAGISTIEARIPRGQPFEYLTWYLARAAEGTGYTLTDCLFSKKSQTCTMLFSNTNRHRGKVRFVFGYSQRFFSKTGTIAFFIEGFGFEADQTTLDYLSFEKPLTVGLSPATSKSDWASKIADYYHKEIVIMLPLEPLAAVAGYKGPMIMIHHESARIDAFIEKSAKSMPDFSGFSNLYGSRALEDTRVTTLVLEDIKQHRGYFLDTRTTDKSLAPALAVQLGVPCSQIDFRIGKKSTERVLDSLVAGYIEYAQKKGTAIVVAPPIPALIKVLAKKQDTFDRSGVKLVYVSELIEKQKQPAARQHSR